MLATVTAIHSQGDRYKMDKVLRRWAFWGWLHHILQEDDLVHAGHSLSVLHAIELLSK